MTKLDIQQFVRHCYHCRNSLIGDQISRLVLTGHCTSVLKAKRENSYDGEESHGDLDIPEQETHKRLL